MNQQELWKELSEVLSNHFGSCACQETLNRLFLKALLTPEGTEDRVPSLSSNNVQLLQEEWSTEQLVKLLKPAHITHKEPHDCGQVVVARWKQNEYLIDGRKRINSWRRNDDKGTHPVIIVQIS